MLESLFKSKVYSAYAYSYPHKTAYRHFEEKKALAPIWQQEKRDSLFLYVHIPFCQIRCGFCNLFTLVRPETTLPDLYLDSLSRQIEALKPVIQETKFARFAIGGGTPTFLDERQLERLFTLTDFTGIQPNTPIGIECSPETMTKEKAQLLGQKGVNRISMGVQSFTDMEVKNLARKQDNQQVIQAVELIRQYTKANLNLDLIYGIAGQTPASWLYSLQQALTLSPEELYLYPLYIRTATGLGKIQEKSTQMLDLDEEKRLALYRLGRDYLLGHGYVQVSMRMFRRADIDESGAPVYTCQQDGMLGLGAGARSYTKKIHYSTEYAVGRYGVRDILNHYNQSTIEDFSHAYYGIELNQDDQKRRFVLQSLLIADGLNLPDYAAEFGCDVFTDFPELSALIQGNLAVLDNQKILLTDLGFERADSIGPWLTSEAIKSAMNEFDLE